MPGYAVKQAESRNKFGQGIDQDSEYDEYACYNTDKDAGNLLCMPRTLFGWWKSLMANLQSRCQQRVLKRCKKSQCLSANSQAVSLKAKAEACKSERLNLENFTTLGRPIGSQTKIPVLMKTP